MPGARIAIVVAVALVVLPFGWYFSGQVVAQGECPSPNLVDTIEGRGSQQSPPFTTSTDSFRLSYQTQADTPQATFILSARPVDDPSISASVADADAQGSQTGETFANAPAGRYFLDINTTASVQYTIRIEECGEGGEANPGEGKSTEGTVSPKASPAPPPAPTPPPTPTSQPKTPEPKSEPKAQPKSEGALMNAGGPRDGPVPVMPGDECPKEFPVEKGKGCYR